MRERPSSTPTLTHTSERICFWVSNINKRIIVRFHKLSPTKKRKTPEGLFFCNSILSFTHFWVFEKSEVVFLLNERQDGFFYAHLFPKSSDWQCNSLAFAVLQVEMRIEVDEDPLVRTRRWYHPCASLRRGIRQGVSWRGEVAGRRDSDVTSTFICRKRDNSS